MPKELVVFFLFLAVWLVVTRWLLPRAGVPA
jgi:hypothetical protein